MSLVWDEGNAVAFKLEVMVCVAWMGTLEFRGEIKNKNSNHSRASTLEALIEECGGIVKCYFGMGRYEANLPDSHAYAEVRPLMEDIV